MPAGSDPALRRGWTQDVSLRNETIKIVRGTKRENGIWRNCVPILDFYGQHNSHTFITEYLLNCQNATNSI